MNIELKLRNPQEQFGNVENVREIAHKAVLAYAGLWGMAYDSARYGLENSQELLEKAEKRGEEMEQEFSKWYDRYLDQATDEFSKLRERYGENFEGVKDVVAENTKGVTEVITTNTKVVTDKVLSTVRPGSNGKDVQETVIEVAEAAKETANATKEAVEEMVKAPFDGYNDLTAKEVVAKFDGMDDKALEMIRDYETATKNRVTVLRELDERLAVTA
jgi:hypothetical protein